MCFRVQIIFGFGKKKMEQNRVLTPPLFGTCFIFLFYLNWSLRYLIGITVVTVVTAVSVVTVVTAVIAVTVVTAVTAVIVVTAVTVVTAITAVTAVIAVTAVAVFSGAVATQRVTSSQGASLFLYKA